MSRLVFGEDSLLEVARLLVAYPDPILVVTGDRSFTASGAADRLGDRLASREVIRHSVSIRLPSLEAAKAGVVAADGRRAGVILAVGGGAVIDTAKLMALALTNPGADLLSHSGEWNDALPLVAVPTTAGSGSERTPFAVCYEGPRKHSVSHPSLLPEVAIVDPVLTYSMSGTQTASSGLDALAHAIESSWAVSATEDSLVKSMSALQKAWGAIEGAVKEPTPEYRSAMAQAATEAGAAIATAKTTASHALSYYLTANFSVPHGFAVGVTLGAMLRFNSEVDHDNCAPGVDPRTTRRIIDQVCKMMGARGVEEAWEAMQRLLTSIGAPTRLSNVGISDPDQISEMAGSVNRERLGNNPREFKSGDLNVLLGGLL